MLKQVCSMAVGLAIISSSPASAKPDVDDDGGYYSTLKYAAAAAKESTSPSTEGYYAGVSKTPGSSSSPTGRSDQSCAKAKDNTTAGDAANDGRKLMPRVWTSTKSLVSNIFHPTKSGKIKKSTASASTSSSKKTTTAKKEKAVKTVKTKKGESGSSATASMPALKKGLFWRIAHRGRCDNKQSTTANAPSSAKSPHPIAKALSRHSVYRPVAAVSPSSAMAAVYGANVAPKKINGQILANNAYANNYVFVKYSEDSVVRCPGGAQVTFVRGEILLAATKDCFIKVDGMEVVAAAGSVVLLSNRDGVLKVRNLCEHHQGCVGASIGGRMFPVRAGEELVTSIDFDSLARAASADKVQRRSLSTLELRDGHQVLKCEFETASLFRSSDLLAQLVRSDNAVERSLFGKVLKMSACLQIVTGADGFRPVN